MIKAVGRSAYPLHGAGYCLELDWNPLDSEFTIMIIPSVRVQRLWQICVEYVIECMYQEVSHQQRRRWTGIALRRAEKEFS